MFFSCQSSIGTGSVIVFGDVIGSYNGHCADYTLSTSELVNREEATISISAVNTEQANIKTSCVRFEDQRLNLISSSAAGFTFEKILTTTSVISLLYIAESDSIVVTQTGSGDVNLIFTGARI